MILGVGVILFPASGEAEPLQVVIVGANTCRTLTEHRPSADVEYKPGVDVKGRPVAPADLPAGASAGPDHVRVALKRDVAVTPGALGASEIVVGEVSIDLKTGKAMLNGKPLDEAFEKDVYAACTRR